jgi:hypothetical protein
MSTDITHNDKYFGKKLFGSGYENCPEFGALGGVILKLNIL